MTDRFTHLSSRIMLAEGVKVNMTSHKIAEDHFLETKGCPFLHRSIYRNELRFKVSEGFPKISQENYK